MSWIGVVLHAAPAGARADRRGVRSKRSLIVLDYMDDTSIGLMEVIPDTAEVVPFLHQEVSNIGIVINLKTTVTLPPKGHAPTTLGDFTLLEFTSASRNGVGVTVVGMRIDTDSWAMKSAMGIVENE